MIWDTKITSTVVHSVSLNGRNWWKSCCLATQLKVTIEELEDGSRKLTMENLD